MILQTTQKFNRAFHWIIQDGMHRELFSQFDFIPGIKRLVFVDVFSSKASEKALSSPLVKPLEGAENADMDADILAEITKQKGSAALQAARREAARLRAAGGGRSQDESQAMFDKLSTQGVGSASQISDPAHDDRHMKNVLKNAMEIIEEIAHITPDLSIPVVETAAVWHDTGRKEDPEEHESLGALMAHNEALKLGFSLETATRIFNAIVRHKWSDQPRTLEGHIVRDADKLDFLDGERWRRRIEEKKYDELRYVTDIFLHLRDRLELEASKNIFDRRLPAFLDFIKKIGDKDFELMKKKILTTFKILSKSG